MKKHFNSDRSIRISLEACRRNPDTFCVIRKLLRKIVAKMKVKCYNRTNNVLLRLDEGGWNYGKIFSKNE